MKLSGLKTLNVLRFAGVVLVASLFTGATGDEKKDVSSPTTAPAAAAAASGDGIAPEVREAVRSLKGADEPTRRKVYDVLVDKGDTRLIPSLEAFRDGKLQERDGTMIVYGDSVMVDGKRLFPILDAFTGKPFVGPDGKPVLEEKPLSPSMPGVIRLPPMFRLERVVIADIIAALSLLHPDPEIRRASIRDAGERSIRAFPGADDEERIRGALVDSLAVLQTPAVPTTGPATAPSTGPATIDPVDAAKQALVAAITAAQTEKPAGVFDPSPSAKAIGAVKTAAGAVVKAMGVDTGPAAPKPPATSVPGVVLRLQAEATNYTGRLEATAKNREELPKYAAALKRQLDKEPNGPFAPTLKEAIAQTNIVLGDPAARDAGVKTLGDFGTSRAENMLRKLYDGATRTGDETLAATVKPSLDATASYQRKVRFAQYTFAGLSAGSILVLLALGLAVIFGLMGVINMAHGEFMMVGAFTTFLVASYFRDHFAGAYDYFPLVAIPAAFLMAGLFGLATEYLIIRHLYGRTVETLLATIGVSIILVQFARWKFGDSVSYNAPTWMQGGLEVAPDLIFNRARLYTIVYCALCIATVYAIVNKTKLGLLLRATTQNRQMAAALGVPTRWVDALTFAFGAGLAGMAGVVVPMIDKINPSMGQGYVVESFMVVVVGGVGKLAGAIIAGFGIGAVGKALEPILGSIQAFAATSSVLAKVLVLAGVVLFLQYRPSGLFPAKGRNADA